MQPLGMFSMTPDWRNFSALVLLVSAFFAFSTFDVRADANDELRKLAQGQGRPEIAGLLDRALAGNVSAQTALGHILLDGSYGFRDINLGVEWLEKAARNGNASAAYSLGRLFQYGNSVPADVPRASRWYEKAYELGNACAADRLAMIALNAKPADNEQAVKWFEKCAEGGIGSCQRTLGYYYLFGYAIQQDYVKSLRWLLASLKAPTDAYDPLGIAQRQALVGVQFENGLGTSRNVAEAIKWYGPAAEGGNKHASYALGRLYEEGADVPLDVALGARYFEKAAEAGYAPAQYCLALAYVKGKGLAPDRTNAVKWLILATDERNVDLAERDETYRRNPDLFGVSSWALDPIARAAAKQELVRLGKEMTPEQFEAAKSLAEKFEPTPQSPPPFCGPHSCPSCG